MTKWIVYMNPSNDEADRTYRLPAEWEPHEATWLAWPHNEDDWPGKFAAIPFVYVEILRWLLRGEIVNLLIPDAAAEPEIRRLLQRAGVDDARLRCYPIPTNRVWIRDYGPIFVVDRNGRLAMTDWRFNAWAKYDDFARDDQVPRRIASILHLPRIEPTWQGNHVVMEGGAIDGNGRGLLLATEECLLSHVQERNPGFARSDYEAIFARYFGIEKVIWLGQGIRGDDTHGHVDDLARFVSPSAIVVVTEDDPSDPNYEPLRENLHRLQSATDVHGEPLRIIALPMPEPIFFGGIRLPASYANFYVSNRYVLVPTFNDPNDRRALAILAEAFPDREVVGIHAVDLVWGFGTLHCLTQQQPRA